jgi:uncharacterized membrane protein YsdA (DUF1294 family)
MATLKYLQWAFQALPLCILVLSRRSSFLYVHIILVNACTFLMYAGDKHRAQNGGIRLPENALFLCSALGGSPAAALAQHLLRHKTIKASFVWRYYVCVAIGNILIYYAYF